MLVFSKSNDWISRLIRLFNWGRYSHVEYLEESTGMIWGATPEYGVSVRPLAQMLEESDNVVAYKVNVEYNEQEVLDRIKSQLGKKYDWLAILGFVLRKHTEDKDKWVCSELQDWAFLPQVKFQNTETFKVSPEDILKSPLVSFVKELK